MTWDEPYFFERQHDVREWLFQFFGSPSEHAVALGRAGLEKSWRFCREVPDQHPPVPSLLSLPTGLAAEGLVGPLRAYRLSTVLVFAITAGVLFRFVRTRWGAWCALTALGTLLFNPRVFADAQQITADADLGAFEFLAALAFLHSCETGRAPWRFGMLAALAVMCKATGVLVLPATLAWALLYRPKGWWRPLAWAVPVTPLTMWALNPAWWRSPVSGMTRWVHAFLAYPQKVPVYYLGKVYDSVHTFLPWHNTVVLTAVMVPVGLLILAVVGLAAVAWESARWKKAPPRSTFENESSGPLPDRVVAAWGAIHFLNLMFWRMLPFMPAHDGLRQIVPAFFFFPVLAAYAIRIFDRSTSKRWRGVAHALALVCVGSAAWETIAIHPYELSYYNALIGGPRGAKAAGMETTYYWDAATAEVLDWMNHHLPKRTTVLIFPPPEIHTLAWEQRWGRLREDLVVMNFEPNRFNQQIRLMLEDQPCVLIFQMRQGLYEPRKPGDPTLFARLANARAAFELAPARVGVRLLAIFDQNDFRKVLEKEVGRARGLE
jgi:hypothetical protein